MKLKKLVIQNFLSIQHTELSLDDKGIIAIEGINHDKTGSDNNGAGKSSVINAILWCNYGTYGKVGTADDVVNSKAGKNCFVRSEWQDDSRTYEITRFRKHGKYHDLVRVVLNGKDITKAGAKAVQEQINEILGANEMVFRAQCFVQQETPLDIPGMSDSELKKLLETILPLENLDELYKAATKSVNEQEARISKLHEELTLKDWQIDHNKKLLKEALDARLNYTKEIDSKNDIVDGQIKAKRLARGVALTMANKGTLEKEIAELEARQGLIGDCNVGARAAHWKIASQAVEKLEMAIANPNNKCGECGQEVEDLKIYFKRKNEELTKMRQEATKQEALFKTAADNLKQHSDLEVQIQELQNKVIEANRASSAVERLEAEIRLLEGQKATAGENPHQATVTRHRDALRENYEGQKVFREELAEATVKLETLKAVQLTYSPKGLRYHILEKVSPKLTEFTNHYLNILTDGTISAVWSTVTRLASGEFREKFSIEARMEGRNKFGLLSGGEKRKVRLACFFALQDLIASQATKNIELWVGDEIDHALDEAGLERLMTVLNEKLEQKKTILVISHNDLKGWIPQSIRVTRKDGISTVVQDT